jgi:hypothetical protein
LKKPAILVRPQLGIGALVEIISKKEDGKRKVAKYITHLSILRASSELVAKKSPIMQSEGRFYPELQNQAHVILHGRRTGEEETWCVF